jgi:hypothetical protein
LEAIDLGYRLVVADADADTDATPTPT